MYKHQVQDVIVFLDPWLHYSVHLLPCVITFKKQLVTSIFDTYTQEESKFGSAASLSQPAGRYVQNRVPPQRTRRVEEVAPLPAQVAFCRTPRAPSETV